MSQKASISTKIENSKLKVNLEILDQSLLGKRAKIILNLKFLVHRINGINEIRKIYSEDFVVGEIDEFLIELGEGFTYLGEKLDIIYELEVIFNGSTKINKNIAYNVVKKDSSWLSSKETKKIVGAKDKQNFFKSFNILTLSDKIKYIVLRVLLPIIFIGCICYLLYDKSILENGGGKEESSLLNIVLPLCTVGIIISQLFFKIDFTQYITLWLKDKNIIFSKDGAYELKNIIEGVSKVDLENVKIKIVAYNQEMGQYRGEKERVRSFSNSVGGIEIFKRTFSFIPKNTDIGEYLDGEVCFKDVYNKLIPSFGTLDNKISNLFKTEKMEGSHTGLKLIRSQSLGSFLFNTGLELLCEIQLISDKYADKKIQILINHFDKTLFSKKNFSSEGDINFDYGDLKLNLSTRNSTILSRFINFWKVNTYKKIAITLIFLFVILPVILLLLLDKFIFN